MNRPSYEPDTTYTPMGRRPDRLECGTPAHSGHLSPPCCLVGWMMHEYRMEIDARMHVHTAPDANDGGKPWAPWSRPMKRRVGELHLRDEWERPDVPDWPFDAALGRLRRWCAGKHRMLPDHRGEPLCWMLVNRIVSGQRSVYRAALELELTPERARRLLHDQRKGAADLLWSWVAERVNEVDLSYLRPSA